MRRRRLGKENLLHIGNKVFPILPEITVFYPRKVRGEKTSISTNERHLPSEIKTVHQMLHGKRGARKEERGKKYNLVMRWRKVFATFEGRWGKNPTNGREQRWRRREGTDGVHHYHHYQLSSHFHCHLNLVGAVV